MQEIGNQQPAEKRVSSLSFCTHWRRFSWSRKKLTFVIVLKNSTPKTRKHLVSFGKLSLLVKILAENGMPRSLASWFFGWMEGFFRLLFSTTDETVFQLAFNKSFKMRNTITSGFLIPKTQIHCTHWFRAARASQQRSPTSAPQEANQWLFN